MIQSFFITFPSIANFTRKGSSLCYIYIETSVKTFLFNIAYNI